MMPTIGKFLRLGCALTLFSTFSLPVQAGFDEGVAAYNKGDYATALREWRPLAEQGNAKAQHRLGHMYRYGLGVLQVYAEAMKWFLRAAEQGNASAQYELGHMYSDVKGVTQDYVQAHKWYNLAAVNYASEKQMFSGLITDFAVIDRDALAEQMTPAQIAVAQRLAFEWTPCGEPPENRPCP